MWIDFSESRFDLFNEFSRLQVYTMEKLNIINVSSYISKSNASEVFNDFEVTFLEEEGGAVFRPFLNCAFFIQNAIKSKKYVDKFPWLLYFKRYFVNASSFSALNLFLYCVNFFLRKLSNFNVQFFSNFRKVSSSRFLKRPFHFLSIYSRWRLLVLISRVFSYC